MNITKEFLEKTSDAIMDFHKVIISLNEQDELFRKMIMLTNERIDNLSESFTELLDLLSKEDTD